MKTVAQAQAAIESQFSDIFAGRELLQVCRHPNVKNIWLALKLRSLCTTCGAVQLEDESWLMAH